MWGSWELLIVAGVFLLLFGGAKLPGLMRNLGRSVNEFKAGIKDPVEQGNIANKDDAAQDGPDSENGSN
jgi:sec-independent protein translocase protein TatA